jgi:oxygen-independent coproporphyrinogen-3 oxidase
VSAATVDEAMMAAGPSQGDHCAPQGGSEAAAKRAASVGAHFQPRGRPRFSALPPLSLYVHMPWCVRKCPYCDFNSHEWRGVRPGPPEDAYVDALVADLERALPSIWGRSVISVFIGGGTPSLFSPDAIDRFLAAVRARVRLAPEAEVTMEANPGTFERAKFEGFRAAGVNRLSIGVQSFDARHLAALGRIHDADEARDAARAAVAIFGNVNLDMMFGLPGQTMDDCARDVASAVSFGTPHLSFYQLTLEPNTRFYRDPPALPDDDLVADMQTLVESMLAEAGYRRYEVSAYAKPGRECAHNLNYWRFGDYLGIGAGAHSKLSFPDRVVREVRYRQPAQYMERVREGDGVMERHEVGERDAGFEFMLNALRLTDGVPSSFFAERTGFAASTIAGAVADAERQGLLEADPARFVATPLGRRFLNRLIERFLPDDDAASGRPVTRAVPSIDLVPRTKP